MEQFDQTEEAANAQNEKLVTTRSEGNRIKGGCIFCREEKDVVDVGELEKGDHITTRGAMRCLGHCYRHHEIVYDIIEGPEARVIGVQRKGDPASDKSPLACVSRFCCCSCCCCCGCTPADRSYNIETGILSDGNFKSKKVKKLLYNKRRNSLNSTANIASTLEGKKSKENYNLLLLNCEHFANLCVNGKQESTPNIVNIRNESTSLQSRLCYWRLFHVFLWFVQAFLYFLNFNVFVAFISNAEHLDLMHLKNSSFDEKLCVIRNNHVPGFNTRCDWIVLSLLLVALTISFVCASYCYYQKLYRHGYICSNCLRIARLDFLSRVLTSLIIEVVNIYLEYPIYKFSIEKNWSKTCTYFFVALISMLTAYGVYSLSNLFTCVFGMCCFTTWERACKVRKYFEFRGFIWKCIQLWKCVKYTLKIVMSKLRHRLLKAAFWLGLHYFQPRLNSSRL